jgi:uncharacterized damage-inducible protein DinB
MIDQPYLVTMAAYNRWQNANLYSVADTLDDGARRADRGAFFQSIHATLNHLLWADQIWMSRFAGTQPPRAASIADSLSQHESWEELSGERARFDQVIVDWAHALDPAWLAGNLTWLSGAMRREVTRPRWLLVVHMFNHQTHHRGQVHAMLTAAGVKPGDTDLAFMS